MALNAVTSPATAVISASENWYGDPAAIALDICAKSLGERPVERSPRSKVRERMKDLAKSEVDDGVNPHLPHRAGARFFGAPHWMHMA